MLLLTRYDGDNNACNLAEVTVSYPWPEGAPERVYSYLTDDDHIYTQIPLFPGEDGKLHLELLNNSITVIEL